MESKGSKMINIPEFRMKKKENDDYMIGLLKEVNQSDGTFKHFTILGQGYIGDESTLAIHFPDMIDSEGNKIFASLSEDGKGGDIVEVKSALDRYYDKVTMKYPNLDEFKGYQDYDDWIEFTEIKVTGVFGIVCFVFGRVSCKYGKCEEES